VSNYHWEMKLRSIPDGYPMERFVPEWMNRRFWPRIGSWADHVISWLSTREESDAFLLVHYEDLKQDPRGELARVARFLGLDGSPQRLERAIDLSSAERMRDMERQQGAKWVATTLTRHDKPFVRKGEKGGWQAVLPGETVAYMESQWGELMEDLGYELVAQKRISRLAQ
jgi:sulfotransferase